MPTAISPAQKIVLKNSAAVPDLRSCRDMFNLIRGVAA
jgi:hypothetical protein